MNVLFLHTIGKMETYDINCDIDVEKIHEILFDGCDMSDMEEPVSLASHPGPPNMDNEVSEETCDTDVEEIIENCQEKSDTEQNDTDISSSGEEEAEFYVCYKKKEKEGN